MEQQPPILTDEEIELLEAEEKAPVPAVKAQAVPPVLTDDDMAEAEEAEAGGILESLGGIASSVGGAALDGAVWLGNLHDSYGGAPSRAALDRLVEGKNPAKGFSENFGGDTTIAPTGQGITQKALAKAGIPDASMTIGKHEDYISQRTGDYPLPLEESPTGPKGVEISLSDVGGTAINTLWDWTNLFPATLAAKGLAKGLTWTGQKLLKKSVDVADSAIGAGGVISRTRDSVGKSLESLATYFNPSRADDYPTMLDVAERHGIDADDIPESIEFGSNSLINRRTMVKREGAMGAHLLDRHQRFADKVNGALTTKIEKYGDGVVRNRVEAGLYLRELYNSKLKKFLDNVDVTYNYVAKMNPGVKLSQRASDDLVARLNGLEQWAVKRIENASTRKQSTQARQVLRTIENARKKQGDYSSLLELMQSTGEIAFGVSNVMADIPPDITKFRELYKAISHSLVTTADDVMGETVGSMLRVNNKQLHEVFGNNSLLAKHLGSTTIGTETIFDSLIMKGDTRTLDALKFLLDDPKDLDGIKGTILEQFIKRNAEGDILYSSTIKGLRQKKDTLLAKVFTPDELGEIDEILRLGNAAGPAVMSSSGTGASNALRDIGKNVADTVTDDALIEGLKSTARSKAPLVKEAIPGARALPPAPNKFAELPSPTLSQKTIDALKFTKIGKVGKAAQVAGVTISAPEVVDGFLVHDLLPIPPENLEYEKSRIKNSDLSTTEKARVLNVINKHGKMPKHYLEQ